MAAKFNSYICFVMFVIVTNHLILWVIYLRMEVVLAQGKVKKKPYAMYIEFSQMLWSVPIDLNGTLFWA